MNYLLFNNQILISDGISVRRIDKDDDIKGVLRAIEQVKLSVVDIDVLIAASVEFPVEKKDSILVRKFKELYQHESYIIQDEKIDSNLFQIIGIKEQKVREVYSLIPSERVESFIPYAIALRNALISKAVDFNKTIVFVDDLGSERLVTVFDGLRFSRTRVIVKNVEDILPEIKRSQIDFFKKTEEFLSKKNMDFVIIVNDQALAAEISKNTESLQVEFLDLPYPALEGLKITDTPMNFRLPEEHFRKRKEIELKKRVIISILSLCVVIVGLVFFLFNKMERRVVNNQCRLDRRLHQQWDERLHALDKETYREDLRSHKTLDYGGSYLSMLAVIPVSYTVNSFKIYKKGKWNIEMTLFVDGDGAFDAIPRIRALKNAEIKDIIVNNEPGKHVRVTL